MKQAIVILIKNKKIDNIRKKYEPYSKFIKPHITIAFPFENINQSELKKHINNSILGVKPFKLILNGIKKSPKEYYLYLLVQQGKKQILKIHKKLYSKLLTKWLRKEIPYIPHATLGIFKTKKDMEEAIKDIKIYKLNINLKIDKVELISLNRNLSIKSKKEFKLTKKR